MTNFQKCLENQFKKMKIKTVVFAQGGYLARLVGQDPYEVSAVNILGDGLTMILTVKDSEDKLIDRVEISLKDKTFIVVKNELTSKNPIPVTNRDGRAEIEFEY